MKRFGKILEKNAKFIWRSKNSVLIILLAPLLITFLLGLAFNNTQPYSIALGVYSSSYSELKNTLIDDLAENFKVNKFHSESDCQAALKEGQVHVCVFLPDDISLRTDNASTITFYVDNARVNLVWMILDTLSSRLATSSSEMSYTLTKQLIDRLDLTKRELGTFQTTLTTLKNDTQSLTVTIIEITEEISDLNISRTREEAEQLFTQSTRLEEQLKPYFSLQEDLGGLTSKIASLQNDLSSYNISSSTRTKIADSLVKLEDQVTTLQTATRESATSAQNITNELKTSIDSINRNVFSVQTTLDTILQKSDVLLGDLNQNIARIDVLAGHVNTILDSIDTLQVTDVSKIVNPLITEIRPVASQKSRLALIFPTLLVLIIMFTAMLLSSSLIAAEHKSKAFLRNKILPASKGIFLAADIISSTVIVTIQTLFFIFVSFFFLKTTLSFGWLGSLTIIIIISLFTLVGLFLGHLFSTEQASLLASLSLSGIFLFLSNTILPLESIPPVIQRIVHYNPFVIGERLLRKIMIHQLDFLTVQQDFILLLVYVIITFLTLFVIIKVKDRAFLA